MVDANATATLAGVVDRFGAALASGDIEPAVGQFQDDCYWRDLVAFTWNIITMEGRDGVRDMLSSQLAATMPSGWALAEGEASRGRRGHRRLVRFETERGARLRPPPAEGRPDLDAADHHGRAQGPRGTDADSPRPMGAKHGAANGSQDLAGRTRAGGRRARPHDAALLCDRRRRAGRHRARRAAAAARRADHHRRQERAPRRQLAQALQVAVPARPGLVRPSAVHADFPKNWPVFSPKDKIGDWLEMYTRVMELNYWASTECQAARSYDEATRNGPWWSSATAKTITLRPKQLVLATGMSGKPNLPHIQGHGRLQGRPAPFLAAPRTGRLSSARSAWCIGSNNSAHDICAALWEARRRRHDGPALLHAHRHSPIR